MAQPTWSSEREGWWISFADSLPEEYYLLPAGQGPGTRMEAQDTHFAECVKQLELLIDPLVKITSTKLVSGMVYIVGPQDVCERLKEEVEKLGWQMQHNTYGFAIARPA